MKQLIFIAVASIIWGTSAVIGLGFFAWLIAAVLGLDITTTLFRIWAYTFFAVMLLFTVYGVIVGRRS